MTKLLIFLTLLSLSTQIYAGRSFSEMSDSHNVRINVSPTLSDYDTILSSVWPELPQKIELPAIPFDDEGDLQANLINGHINLGDHGKKLFSVTPLGDNKIHVEWDLSQLFADVNIGVHVEWGPFNKDLEANVKADTIESAQSVFQIVFNKETGRFHIESISNEGFEFKNIVIDVTSTGIVDELIEQVVDTLDETVRESINTELKDQLNGGDLITEINDLINEQLLAAEGRNIDIGQIASTLKIQYANIDIQKNAISLAIDTRFNNEESQVHPCAKALVLDVQDSQNSKKNHVRNVHKTNFKMNSGLAPHRFVERIVNNLATYKTDTDADGITDEPLFCFGYKDGSDEGAGVEESFEFKVLGKKMKVNIKYWAVPISKPTYKYDIFDKLDENGEVVFDENGIAIKDHLITMSMDAEIRLKNTRSYPKLILPNKTIKTSLTATAKLKLVKGKGIIIDLKSLKFSNFRGKLKFKWKKLTPAIKVPFSKLRSTLEEELTLEARAQLQNEVIIDEILPLLKMKVKLEKYEMLENDHRLEFTIDQ